MKCLFYEATGKLDCPFHRVQVRYEIQHGDKDFIIAHALVLNRKKGKRRKNGKSR